MLEKILHEVLSYLYRKKACLTSSSFFFQLLNIAQKLLGRRLFEALMKSTFYGHFVAGELKEEIRPKIDLMERFGVGAILDYAVEADMPGSSNNVIKYEPGLFINEIGFDFGLSY